MQLKCGYSYQQKMRSHKEMMALRVYYFLADLAVLISYEIDVWNLGIITMWRGGLCKESGQVTMKWVSMP